MKRRLVRAVVSSLTAGAAWLAVSAGAAQYPTMPYGEPVRDTAPSHAPPPQPEAWRPMPSTPQGAGAVREATAPEIGHFDYYVGGYDRYYGDDWFFDFYSFDPDAREGGNSHAFVDYDYSLGVFAWEELGIL